MSGDEPWKEEQALKRWLCGLGKEEGTWEGVKSSGRRRMLAGANPRIIEN